MSAGPSFSLNTTKIIYLPVGKDLPAQVTQVSLNEPSNGYFDLDAHTQFYAVQDEISALISTIIVTHRSHPLPSHTVKLDDPSSSFYLLAQHMPWPYGKDWLFEVGESEPLERVPSNDLKWIFIYIPKSASSTLQPAALSM